MWDNQLLDIIYLRLSSEDMPDSSGEKAESISISSQRACIHQHLEANPGICDNITEIIDEGFSGTNMERPGMKKLLSLVEARKVRTIIVRDLSRFARNYLEAGHYLEFVFPAYNIRFISINDHFDSKLVGESTGGLDLAIRNLINQMYSRDISRKIKSVVDMKKLRGEYAFGAVPYGYKKGEKRNTIIVDEPAAETVRTIFELACNGHTISSIARRLNETAVTTPSAYLANIRGNYKVKTIWTYESVRNILQNRVYTGDTEAFKSHVTKIGSNHVNLIPEEQRLVIPNTHEAIITREQYYRAKNVVKVTAKKSKPSRTSGLLQSYLVCSCCGNRLSKGKQQNKDWLCSTARYTSDTDCKGVRANDEQIQRVILRAIQSQCSLVDTEIERIMQSEIKNRSTEAVVRAELKKYQRKIDLLQAQRITNYEDFISGQMTKESFLALKQETAQNEEQARLQLSLLQKKLSELSSQSEMNSRATAESEPYRKYKGVTELTPGLIKELIKRVIVYSGGKIHIEWNFNDTLLRPILFKDVHREETSQCH